MITAETTKHGTGIQLWGDYGDLKFLYETVSKLMLTEENTQNKYAIARGNLISFFCYELRHAYQGDRDSISINYTEKESPYLGFKIDWITYIVTLSCLRDNMKLVTIDEADIANIRLLEFWGKKAMQEFDKKGAALLEKYMNVGVLTDEYVYLIHQHLVQQYYQDKPTVSRFRNIAQSLYDFYVHSNKKQLLEMQIKEDASRLQCDLNELEVAYEDIDFKW